MACRLDGTKPLSEPMLEYQNRTLANFSEILSEILPFSFQKMLLNMSSAKWRLFLLGLNVLTLQVPVMITLVSTRTLQMPWRHLAAGHQLLQCSHFHWHQQSHDSIVCILTRSREAVVLSKVALNLYMMINGLISIMEPQRLTCTRSMVHHGLYTD